MGETVQQKSEGVFGIIIHPYRFLRQDARERKQKAQRYRELIAALAAQERDRQTKKG